MIVEFLLLVAGLALLYYGSEFLVRGAASLPVEMPIMLAVCVLFWVICLDGVIGWGDGVLLLAILFAFLGYSIWTARDKNGDTVRAKPSGRTLIRNGVMIVGGLIGLAKGADMVVQSAIIMAREIGLSEAFIGISIVALGTSLPELATSAVAAAQGKSDISVGNVVGSNIFNVCMVMGLVGLIQPMTIDKALLTFEFPFMVFIVLKCQFTSQMILQFGCPSGFNE